MTSFEFATAARILFGPGKVQELAGAIRRLGTRVLLVCGASTDRAGRVASAIRSTPHHIFSVPGEPTLEAVRQGVETARSLGCDVVVAVGGGSPIDAGKAIASLLANGGDPLDYLEVVGKGLPIERPSVPFLAIPTTAGAGAEVTRNAVLKATGYGVKASLRSPYLLANMAIVDPELSCSMPKPVTAATGMDALTQLIEPYVSVRANPMTDMLCVEGMRLVARSLERAFHNGSDLEARQEMAFASLLGGMALANAGLGAVHGFAAPIGGAFEAPHGAVCAALLAPTMQVNLKALRQRQPNSFALDRYAHVAQILTGQPHASPEDGVRWVGELAARLEIPPLGCYGLGAGHIADLTAKAAQSSSMKGNPISLEPDELAAILSAAIGHAKLSGQLY
ncbi:MAG: iron-containing alcohol dehydrogenase [Bryobacteraceae bacterium]|nr:iron-containing alcohol dehydrogenase [Bryobacteraceae bacterium]MDW8377861.1 iron-containing alcohol dehydrogenase [Bryobacterales bacterium]